MEGLLAIRPDDRLQREELHGEGRRSRQLGFPRPQTRRRLLQKVLSSLGQTAQSRRRRAHRR